MYGVVCTYPDGGAIHNELLWQLQRDAHGRKLHVLDADVLGNVDPEADVDVGGLARHLQFVLHVDVVFVMLRGCGRSVGGGLGGGCSGEVDQEVTVMQ